MARTAEIGFCLGVLKIGTDLRSRWWWWGCGLRREVEEKEAAPALPMVVMTAIVY